MSSEQLGTLSQMHSVTTQLYETIAEQPQTPIVVQYNSQEHEMAVQIICKISMRSYSRRFMKNLMFNYIQSLKRQKNQANSQAISQGQSSKTANWPFRQLYYKPRRTPDEQELLQFVNLCAQLIQSRFKAYLARKRHLIAFRKASRAADLISSFLKRCKVRRVYNCDKIVHIRAKIRAIQQQIDLEEGNYANRDAKKLKGLYKYYQIHTKMFQDNFNLLMETGMWTLEKDMRPKPASIPRRQQKVVYQHSNQIINRVADREPQVYNEQNSRKQNININKQEEAQSMISTVANNYSIASSLEDRPIKAAGQYKIEDSELETIKDSNNQVIEANNSRAREEKAAHKVKQAHKMEKRKKYDPRKAIEQQRKKKTQLKGEEPKEPLPNKTVPMQMYPQEKQQQPKDQEVVNQRNSLNPKEDENKKTLKIKKTAPKNPEAAKNQNSGLKQNTSKKVTSKVDCWGSKKQQEPEWVKEYKARIIEQNRVQNQQKMVQVMRKSVQKIEVRRPENAYKAQPVRMSQNIRISRQQQKQQYIKTESDVPKKRAANEAWQHKQIQSLKQKQTEYIGRRKNSSELAQQQVRATIQRQNMARRKQVHRPIEQLEETYNKHYGQRYQNLIPKLKLLATAREQERQSRIPVIDELSGEFDQWFDHLYRSTLFWKKAAEYERIYKSFVSS